MTEFLGLPVRDLNAENAPRIQSRLARGLFTLSVVVISLAVLIVPFYLGLRLTRDRRQPLWGWPLGAVLFAAVCAGVAFLLRFVAPMLPEATAYDVVRVLTTMVRLQPLWIAAALVAGPLWLGAYLSRKWRMPDYSLKIAVIVFCVIAGLVISILGWPPKLGIDLSGGVILVYEFEGQPAGERPEAAKPEEAKPGENGKAAETSQREKVDIDKLIQAIRLRVDPGGVKELTIRQRGERQIEVIIPRADEEELARIKKKISSAGTLEFRILANRRDHAAIIAEAEQIEGQELSDSAGNLLAWWVPVARGEEEKLVQTSSRAETVYRKRTLSGHERIEFLVVKDVFNVTGAYLVRAATSVDPSGRPCVLFTFNHRGGLLFGGLTASNRPDEAQDFYRHLGIILDGYLQSAPQIRTTIFQQGEITGDFTRREVDDLVDILNAGSLPTALSEEPVSEMYQGPALGRDTIERGEIAIILSMVLVLAFMAYYYRFAGFVACAALVMNLIMILAIMISVKAAFTLPGLAGLVLTVGMAVDANVLIFERIREELARQAKLRMAIRNGFGRATSAIVDSNLTTLITATVLYVIGTDQIKGFAVTLWLGVVLSMFTAIYCSRVVFDVAEKRNWISKLKMHQFVGQTQVDFIAMCRVAVAASLLVIAVGLVAVVGRGAGLLDIDFTGGASVQVVFNKPQDIANIRAKLGEGGQGLDDLAVFDVQTLEQQEPGREFMINTSGPRDLPPNTDSEVVLADVKQRIQNAFGKDLAHRSLEVAFLDPKGDGGEPPGKTPPTAKKEEAPNQTFAKLEFQRKIGYERLSDAIRKDVHDQHEAGTLAPAAVTFELYTDQDFSTIDPEAVGRTWFVRLDLPPAEGRTLLDKMKERVDSEPVFPSSNTIGGQVAQGMRVDAIAALLASMVFIVGYLWVRFQRVMYGLAAVVALIHDVLITLGLIALTAYVAPFLGWLGIAEFKIGLSVLAAFLTIIGYSLNDTIIVFDRIREVKGKAPQLTAPMINTSINQTLSRTLLTSGTTLLVVVVLYIGGGQAIHVFSFALVAGVVVGTYSSIFIASPILYWMTRDSGAKPKGRLSSRGK